MSQPCITITDPKIVSFFDSNADSIDPTAFLHTMIDLYEYMKRTMTSTNSDQILRHILENTSNLTRLETELKNHREIQRMQQEGIARDLSKIAGDVNSTIIGRLMEMKDMYIYDLKNILSNEHNEKISQQITNNNLLLLNGIRELLMEGMNRMNQLERAPIEQAINNLQGLICQETSKIVLDKKDSLIGFIDVFNSRCNELSNCMQNNMASMIRELKDSSLQVNSLLDKFNNSNQKGRLSENILVNLLTKMFPTGEVKETRSEAHSCDVRLHRLGRADILFENKSYTRNVNKDEVTKFLDDLRVHECNGIMISQESGITHKPDFHIDISESFKVAVYLHNVNYDAEKIKLAVDIVDHLGSCLGKVAQDGKEDGISIAKDALRIINQEYQAFIKNREGLITYLRESNNEAILKVKNMDMPQLVHLLRVKDNSSGAQRASERSMRSSELACLDRKGYRCKQCNNFEAESRKELMEHKKTVCCVSS